MRFLYRVLLLLLLPAAFIGLEIRARRQTGKADAWGERLGFVTPLPDGCLWLHAASIGEVQAAIPLVKALRERYPDAHLLVTTFTATGRRRALAAFESFAGVSVAALPWDVPGPVRRFIRRVRPRALIVLETEIWPGLLRALGRRGIPSAIVSARLGERTARRYAGLRGLIRPVVTSLSLVAAQSNEDAERYRELGSAAVIIGGNIKFDVQMPAGVREQGEAIRMSLFPHRPVLVAASTRDGEEAILLDALAEIRAAIPDVLLVIAPRYPERGAEIAALAERRGFEVVKRSSSQVCESGTGVFVLDTLGELNVFYAAGHVAFVGGSLVPVGGHNLVEPAALGMPVLTGPHTYNAPDIAEQLVAAGGASIVTDAGALAAAAVPLLQDSLLREQMGDAARAVAEANRGALARTMDALEDVIPLEARKGLE